MIVRVLMLVLISVVSIACQRGISKIDEKVVDYMLEREIEQIKEQGGLIATEKDRKEYEDLTKGMKDSVLKVFPDTLSTLVNNFVRGEFGETDVSHKFVVYHPVTISKKLEGLEYVNKHAIIDTNSFHAVIQVVSPRDTSFHLLMYNDDFHFLYHHSY